MLCKNCGAQLPDGTERCEFCGAELMGELEQDTMVFDPQELEAAEGIAEEAEEEEILDENELNRRAQMEKMMAEKQMQLSEIEKRRNIKKKRQRQTKIAIICAICAACVAIVGFGSYAVKESLSNRPEPSPSPSPTVASTMAAPTPLTTTPAPLGSMAPGATPSSVIGSNSSNSANGSNGSSSNGSSSTSASRPSGSGASSSSSNTGTSSGGSSSVSQGNSPQSGTASSVNSSSSATSVAKPSGISTATVDAKLTTGGEVLYNNDTGRYLMTFATGNTLYYANVSEGSTTEQIKNKNITITAHPTEERYKGNTIYEITSMTYYDDSDYIIPQSGTKLLSKDEVKNMSKEQLALARNEIYARHGRKFQMARFRDYFTKKSWYKENPGYNYDNEGSNLNEIETKNVNLLLSVENSK